LNNSEPTDPEPFGTIYGGLSDVTNQQNPVAHDSQANPPEQKLRQPAPDQQAQNTQHPCQDIQPVLNEQFSLNGLSSMPFDQQGVPGSSFEPALNEQFVTPDQGVQSVSNEQLPTWNGQSNVPFDQHAVYDPAFPAGSDGQPAPVGPHNIPFGQQAVDNPAFQAGPNGQFAPVKPSNMPFNQHYVHDPESQAVLDALLAPTGTSNMPIGQQAVENQGFPTVQTELSGQPNTSLGQRGYPIPEQSWLLEQSDNPYGQQGVHEGFPLVENGQSATQNGQSVISYDQQGVQDPGFQQAPDGQYSTPPGQYNEQYYYQGSENVSQGIDPFSRNNQSRPTSYYQPIYAGGVENQAGSNQNSNQPPNTSQVNMFTSETPLEGGLQEVRPNLWGDGPAIWVDRDEQDAAVSGLQQGPEEKVEEGPPSPDHRIVNYYLHGGLNNLPMTHEMSLNMPDESLSYLDYWDYWWFPTNRVTATINNPRFHLEPDDAALLKSNPQFQQLYRAVFGRFLKYLGIELVKDSNDSTKLRPTLRCNSEGKKWLSQPHEDHKRIERAMYSLMEFGQPGLALILWTAATSLGFLNDSIQASLDAARAEAINLAYSNLASGAPPVPNIAAQAPASNSAPHSYPASTGPRVQNNAPEAPINTRAAHSNPVHMSNLHDPNNHSSPPSNRMLNPNAPPPTMPNTGQVSRGKRKAPGMTPFKQMALEKCYKGKEVTGNTETEKNPPKGKKTKTAEDDGSVQPNKRRKK
jgi:hypothetical protein